MPFFQLAIFLFILATLIFIFHYYIYISCLYLFSLSSPTVKNTLLIVLIFLSLSFFLSSFLSHWNENFLTRAYYLFSGIWLGLLANLILVFSLSWLIVFLSRFLNFRFEPFFWTTFLVFLAGIFTAYGIWSAFNPKIKEISVKIPGLPQEWQGKKIIHLSDLHLGQVYQEDFMEKIIQKINFFNPELILITGDLFDGMDGNLDSHLKPFAKIHSEKGIFFVLGNHETYLGVEKTKKALEKTSVKILEDEIVDVSGLKIIGISYPERTENKNILAILQKMKSDYFGEPNILLYHSPVHIREIQEEGINLELCGHAHHGQIFPLNFITHLIYGEYDYGLHTIGNYTLYTSNGIGTWGPSVRTTGQGEIVVITLK